MKVVLLGYMASGKTTIGKKLADKLCLPFLDLDRYIESKEGKTVSDLFATKGEIYFRKVESLYLEELLGSPQEFVLSLGGGTPCYSGNMDKILASDAISVYLKGSIQTLVERVLLNKEKRPLVANIADQDLPEFIGKHLFERRNDYERAAIKINIDNNPKEGIIDAVWLALQ